ncbi:MAG TPA: hypothetical protein VNT81_00545 [Vicinamibacterales bacterium]|nr:hypothetical protein [Vicinamibacterales bacterium]
MANTKRFGRIYEEVTADLLSYLAELELKGEIDHREIDWFKNGLIAGFEAEYQSWSAPADPRIAAYLAAFDKWSVNRDLRLAAHVYLHVAYDLPRVIANSFSAYWDMRRGNGPRLFVRPGPRFLRIFHDNMRRGVFGVTGKIAGRFDAAQTLGYWIVALRSVAWIHGDLLTEFGGGQARMDIESDMADGLLAAATEALDYPWLFGIHNFDNSELIGQAPLGGLIEVGADSSTITIAASAALAAAGIAAVRRRRALSAIEVLGALTYRNMGRAINPQKGLVTA